MSPSSTFCILPWLHLYVQPNGEVAPCCHADLARPCGNVAGSDLEAIFNSESFKRIRRDMLRGERAPECASCYRLEDVHKSSPRQNHNREFQRHLDKVNHTRPDGSLRELSLVYLDLRFSNVCNLKCRGCYPGSSSSWAEDFEQLTGTKVTKKLSNLDAPAIQEILAHLDHVENIYFAGGEPLIMQENYLLLDKLLELKRTNIALLYNTNLMQLSHGKHNILDYWKKFSNVIVSASMDDVLERAEYFRKGLDFKVFTNNWKRIRKESPHIQLTINLTVNIMNIFNLHKIFDYFNQELDLEHTQYSFNLLTSPPELSIQVLPLQFKQEVKAKLEAYQRGLSSKSSKKFLAQLQKGVKENELFDIIVARKKEAEVNYLDPIITFMMNGSGEATIQDFFARTEKLDRIRGEDYRKLFPELVRVRATY